MLGKFLPESGQPGAGIFPLRNPDVGECQPGDPEEWFALRYDLTASLARVCAQYAHELPKPFRRYQVGTVWRHEKPGLGRLRAFTQFDVDSVGVHGLIADAEVCALACDIFEALEIPRGDYQIRVNNRKVLAGVLVAAGLDPGSLADTSSQTGAVLRAIDKLDRIGLEGATELLGKGRRDESGDYTKGACLDPKQIEQVVSFLRVPRGERLSVCEALDRLVGHTDIGKVGIDELREIDRHLGAIGRDSEDVAFDATVVRGLGYYTGPVFEGVLTKQFCDESGRPRSFGSLFGGGRYDELVERFSGEKVRAVGGSIGIDRLLEALKLFEPEVPSSAAQVLVAVVERERISWYLGVTRTLRSAGINTEIYSGDGNLRAQLKYAAKLGIPFVLIAGGRELDRDVVQVKQLVYSARNGTLAQASHAEQPTQWEAPISRVVPALHERLAPSRESVGVWSCARTGGTNQA